MRVRAGSSDAPPHPELRYRLDRAGAGPVRVGGVADVSVRPARPGDAAEMARIQQQTLPVAYGSLLPPETTAALSDPAGRAQIAAAIATEIASSAPQRAFVAFDNDTPVGIAFARAGVRPAPGQAPDSALEPGDPEPERTGVLEQFLVEPRWGRRGHGSRLLSATVDYFAGCGYVRAVTWVPEGNIASVDLLTSAGWARDGYVRGLDVGDGTTLREIRFHTSLVDT